MQDNGRDWRQRLREAAAIVEEVRQEMDTSSEECDHCGRVNFRRWGEYLIARQLGGIVRNLERTSKADPNSGPGDIHEKRKAKSGDDSGRGARGAARGSE